MKPKILIPLILILMTTWSCVKDKSNYDYTEINDLTISGIDDSYTINMLDTLKLTPELTGSLLPPDNDADYDFYWTINEGMNNPARFTYPDTLAKTRNLNAVITYPPQSYYISFKAFDRKTGVQYRRRFTLQVMSPLQRGFLALSELNGNANVTFVSVTGEVYEDLYQGVNEEYAGTNPVSIGVMARAPLDYITIVCDDARGGVAVSTLSFKKMFEYRDFFYDNLAVVKPQYFETAFGYGTVTDYSVFVNQSFIVNNNKLHYKGLNYNVTVEGVSTTVETKFFSPFQGDYEIAPRMLRTNLHYDNKYGRFMYIPNLTQPNIFVTAQRPSDPLFDPANLGLRMIWSAPTIAPRNVYYNNAIMTGDDGKYYYIKVNSTNVTAVVPMRMVEVDPTSKLFGATVFAGNLIEDYVYFAKGEKVYVYDPIIPEIREIYDFGAGVVVDKIDWHFAVITERVMWVCTSAVGGTGRTGSIYEMTVAGNGVLTIKNAYENVSGKVVSTLWKN